MTRRKRVEAWAERFVAANSQEYNHGDVFIDGVALSQYTKPPFENGFERVRLVEYDPRAEAVVRLAVKWLGEILNTGHYLLAEDQDLARAVERYLERRKR